jgi:Arc/MetJ-type ribon-helix-helix transcriptional regulator
MTEITFRDENEIEAIDILDGLRKTGVTRSEVVRAGIRKILPEVTTPDEKAAIYGRFVRGKLRADTTKLLLGENQFERVESDRTEMVDAIADDTDPNDLIK